MCLAFSTIVCLYVNSETIYLYKILSKYSCNFIRHTIIHLNIKLTKFIKKRKKNK